MRISISKALGFIVLPGMIVGIFVTVLFSLISFVDGIGDFRLILYYALTFTILFSFIGAGLLVYGKLTRGELSLHHQLYLLNIAILGFVLLFVSSYALKMFKPEARTQPFYGFPRILAFLLPLALFLVFSRMSRKRWKNLIIGSTAFLLLGWAFLSSSGGIDFGSPSVAGERNAPNVLLLTIESLRYDHLGFTSGGKISTNTLDSVIENGTFFSKYFVQAPYTTASLSTIATGSYPFRHGARVFGQKPGAGFIPFIDSLVKNGYSTRIDVSFYSRLFPSGQKYRASFPEKLLTANYVVSAWLGKLFPGLFGGYGFSPTTSIIETTRLIKAIQRNRHRKWFFWTHFIANCHWPYKSPPQFAAMNNAGKTPPDTTFNREEMVDLNANPERIDAGVIDRLHTAYGAEVSCMDRLLGYIINRLKSLGLMERTVVIISADHGESLGEDGLIGHGASLKDKLIHVPLIIYSEIEDFPQEKGKVEALVESVDLAPTILDIAGLRTDKDDADGESLLRLLKQEPWEKDSVYSEYIDEQSRFFASLRTREFKLVWDSARDHFSLYDLNRDTAENLDVSESLPDVVEVMKSRMLALSDKPDFASLIPPKLEGIDKDMKEKLRALGYIK